MVWHSGLTCKASGDIERIQRRACRTILGHQFTTYSESITRCNLIKLSDRRVDHCLSFAMGLQDNPRTRHLIPPTRIAVHGYNLRNTNDLTQPLTKTKRYKQSPVPYFITLLNKHSYTPRTLHACCSQSNSSGYSKYAKVARVHYFCTIALRTSRAVLTRA